MKVKSFQAQLLYKRLLFVFLLLVFLRVFFHAYNYGIFPNDTSKNLQAFGWGLGFDLFCTLTYFLPYTLLFIVLLSLKHIRRWQVYLLDSYFGVLILSISILSIADIFYYRFNLRRINLEAMHLLHDSSKGIKAFAWEHPSTILSLFAVILCVVFGFRWTKFRPYPVQTASLGKGFRYTLIFFLIFFGIVTLKYAKYLSPLSASLMVEPGYTGLYPNSPQSFVYSFRSNWTYVKPLNYFTSNECDQRVPVFYSATTHSQGERKNVMLFILESFSYAYLDPTNKQKPSTPFFDSLITHSTLYTKAFANNITSAQGLCSMLSGLPSLINQPFFGSAYANHQVDAIAIQLGKLGYSTHFAMGANEDHFGFKKGTKLLGIQQYYNGEEFPATQHDGTWGIFDEPFLQHYANLNNQFKQPFFSTLFTISSHYPFKVPDSLQGKFPTIHHTQNEQAVSYVDYSFRKYFDKIKHEPWFQHTIFIFTGDHVSKENEFEQFNFYSYYHIPIFIFDPQHPEGRTESKLVQHTDLPATIADLTCSNLPVLSFGHSFYDTSSYRYTVNRYADNIIQFIDEDYLIQYDVNQHKMLQAYTHHENDSLFIVKQANILDEIKKKQIPILQAYLQQYFSRLFENKLSTRK